MKCIKCGQNIAKSASFCSHCGARQKRAPAAKKAAAARPARKKAAAARPRWKEILRGAVASPRWKEVPRGAVAFAAAALAALVVCLVVAAAVFLPRLLDPDRVLLALPGRDGELDVSLVKLGQDADDGVLLAEGVRWTTMSSVLLGEDGGYRPLGGPFGGFVPGSSHLVLWYEMDDEIVVQQLRVSGTEPIEVVDSRGDVSRIVAVEDSGIIFVRETRDGVDRCYVAQPGGEGDRVARADACDLLPGGDHVSSYEVDRGETTVSVVGVDGEDESVVLDEVEDVSSYRISPDASRVAYIQEDGGEIRLVVVDLDSGDEIEVADDLADVRDYGFAPSGDVFFYTAVEEWGDETGLYLLGSDDPVVEGESIAVRFSLDGRYVAYAVTDEDGMEELHVYEPRSGKDVEVADGDDLAMFDFLPTAPARLVAVVEDGDEVRTYSARPDGSDLVELVEEEDVTFAGIGHVGGEEPLYVRLVDEDGLDVILVTPVDEAEALRPIEGWDAVTLLNRSPDGRQVVFAAAEDPGDDPVLYSVAVEEDAEPIELDDDGEEFVNAVWSSDGRTVIYTAVTGDDRDDVEVRRVRADGRGRFETLYDKAVLVDVNWDEIDPFYYLR